jgi:hypothetical protein
MASVVVVGGIAKCSHQGQVRFTSGDSRLDVDGNNVVVQGQEVGLSFAPAPPSGAAPPGLIAPCPFSTAAGPSPCAATLAATTGISTKVTVGNLGALLDTASGKATNPQDPSATWSIQSAGQSKLESDA